MRAPAARLVAAILAAGLCWASPSARAEPVTLRGASVAPEGSAWAREMHAFARDVELRTGGRVRLKWYLDAVAGGDLEMGQRLRRGQLDLVASGGMLCNEVMPTMRVLRLPGLFQNRDEAKHVMNRLQSTLAGEAQKSGILYAGGPGLGTDMFFLRRPVQRLADLRTITLWRWDLDAVATSMGTAMGLKSAPADLALARRSFDDGLIDGFFALPTAALAFQWSIRARYLLDYKGSFLFGCVLVSNRSFYNLPPDDQKALLTALAHTYERFGEVSKEQEDALLNGAFQHQGVQLVPVSESFRSELFAAANSAREKEGGKLVPMELIRRVQAMLADYRAEQAPAGHP